MNDLVPVIGLLHPGAMGAAIGAQAASVGCRVLWVPDGRSPATRARADAAGLTAVSNLAELCHTSDIIVSVCPPAHAVDVAGDVAETRYSGLYVDANAVSPRTMERISAKFDGLGVSLVDGGIVGQPPSTHASARLYLSGADEAAERVRALFAGSAAVEPVVLSGAVGRASALKLAFAAYNKVSHVLAAYSLALAAGYGVADPLSELAAEALPNTPLGSPARLTSAAAKAWRWEPEFREIADAGTAVGLAPDLLLAAAAILDRWSHHKDLTDTPLPQLIAELANHGTVASLG